MRSPRVNSVRDRPLESDTRLEDLPDQDYLFSEIYWVYRHSSSGGSLPIRRHHREVRERLRRATNSNPPVHFGAPETVPVCEHLARDR